MLAAAAALTSALNAPGSTTATRVATSISIARIRSRLSTIPAVDRGRAAGQAAAGPAGDHRHAVLGRPAHGRLYVVGVAGADHRDRRAGADGSRAQSNR